jgi:hypothetical protein
LHDRLLILREALDSCPMAKVALVMGGKDTAKINGKIWFRDMFIRNISYKRLQFSDISENLPVSTSSRQSD